MELAGQLRNSRKRERVADVKLNVCNKKLKKARQQLKEHKLNQDNVFNYLRTIFNPKQLLFFEMQINNTGKKARGRRYTAEEKNLSLMLYKQSPKNYRLMQRIFILPVKRTLAQHCVELQFQTGVNTKLMDCIKEKVPHLSETEKYCALTWDEVSLKAHIDYSTSRDEIDGFMDLSYVRRPEFATHALTFMVRGIESPFKEPVGYCFTSGLKHYELVELVKIVIEALLDTGKFYFFLFHFLCAC